MTNTGGSMDWESKSVLGKHIRVLVVKKQTKKKLRLETPVESTEQIWP